MSPTGHGGQAVSLSFCAKKNKIQPINSDPKMKLQRRYEGGEFLSEPPHNVLIIIDVQML